MREFKTGATRNNKDDKPEYEGYLSPLVIEAFGRYMMKHQIQADGRRRSADNWQKGMPPEAYMDSAWRHFMDWWLHHRGYPELARGPLEDALMGVLFNLQGYAFEKLKQENGMDRPA